MSRPISNREWLVVDTILGAGFPVSEAAKYSGVGVSTIWKHRKNGHPTIKATIPAYYRAKEMLEVERTSYNEAERTTGIPSRSLRRYFPGLGWEQAGSEGSEYRRMTRMLEKATAHYA